MRKYRVTLEIQMTVEADSVFSAVNMATKRVSGPDLAGVTFHHCEAKAAPIIPEQNPTYVVPDPGAHKQPHFTSGGACDCESSCCTSTRPVKCICPYGCTGYGEFHLHAKAVKVV